MRVETKGEGKLYVEKGGKGRKNRGEKVKE